MALNAGTKLGPYEILGALGAGGMGEVYRARDTRLGRDVAIKVLLAQFSANADLKQRFDREARAISSLQHAHICTLFDVGDHEGSAFLVMELLEGETLAARLQRGPMPLPEVVKVASQVAEALERAHRSGLVHRDLKPGNIMLTSGGAKLMDFGLAKPLAMAANATPHPSNTGLAGSMGAAPLLSAAVTMNTASPQLSPLTSAGTIVGTIQYMSPEQIEGREADARSDIFALGAVLYEMTTGKRAFQGKSQLTVASAILEKDPEPMSAGHAAVPVAFDRIVQTCLAKDPEERFQTARDVNLQLRWVLESPHPGSSGLAGPPAARRWKLVTVGALVAMAALALAWFLRGAPPPQVRAVIEPPDKVVLDSVGDFAGAPALSPDGTKLVFAGHDASNQRSLWVRSLDNFSAQRLEGTTGAAHPFWSADGKSIGFFANLKLNRIPATGGVVTAIADAPNPRGGSWTKDDVILFAPNFQSGIFRVNASGGPAQQITSLDDKHTTHRWPFTLPDGKHFVYLATSHSGGRAEDNGVFLASIDGKQNQFVVASDAGAEYVDGYLLYRSGGALMAQKMDAPSGKFSGAALPVVDKVRHDNGVWRALFTASQTGVLLYQAGTAEVGGSQLLLYDRAGKVVGHVGERGSYMDPRLSPDGKRVAVSYGDPNREIWVFDIERGTQTRLTFSENAGGGAKINPAWSADGKTIVYTGATIASRAGVSHSYMKAANGSGTEKLVVKPEKGSSSNPSFTPDGKYIAYIENNGPNGNGVHAQPVGSGPPVLVLSPASPQNNISFFRISPNGKWIAYSSNETGRVEIYIAPFMHGEGKWQVSTVGALTANWRADGKELFFSTVTGDYMAVSITERGEDLEISSPTRLFSANVVAIGTDFDVAPDGKRFLINTSFDSGVPSALFLVTNWEADLRKK